VATGDFFSPGDLLDLVDWRRRVSDMYRVVRLSPDPAVGCEGWRSSRDELFRSHPQSSIPVADRTGFKGLSYYPYDPALRVTAQIQEVEALTVKVVGSVEPFRLTRFAAASFILDGDRQELELHWFESYGGGLFLSFQDATSGHETYGGCRYLLDTAKGADLGASRDGLILDFNFAYQPSCSYDPAWSCPLAPPANRLSIPVTAGERL
jgi:uncharacterized protein (DUF1684 family)